MVSNSTNSFFFFFFPRTQAEKSRSAVSCAHILYDLKKKKCTDAFAHNFIVFLPFIITFTVLDTNL